MDSSSNTFKNTAESLTIWNASIADRIAAARQISEDGLKRGLVSASSFAQAISAEVGAERIARWVAGDHRAPVYSRIGSPNVFDLEDALSVLESKTRIARAASTGMAAIRAAIFGSIKTGEHIVASRHLFGATTGYLNQLRDHFGVEVSYIDGRDPDEWRQAMKDNTRLFFFETPANPLLHLIDVKEVSAIAHSRDIPVIVDGSMASSLPQQILGDSADVLCLSITKYVSGGHYNGGIVFISNEGAERLHRLDPGANNPDKNKYRIIGNLTGGDALSPANAFHFLEQITRLGDHFRRYSDTAHDLAQYLSDNGIPVLYPGLKAHAQFDLAQRQMLKRADGSVIGGGVFSIDFASQAEAFRVQNVLIEYGASTETNFGQPGLNATHQATNTYASYTSALREECGISEGLVRFSPGLGDLAYIKTALDDALGIRQLSSPQRQVFIKDHRV